MGPDERVARASEATALAYRGLLRFARDKKNGYRETLPPRPWQPYAYLWPLSQALDAAIVVASVRKDDASRAEVRRMLRALERYWDASSTPPGYASGVHRIPGLGKDKYFDDNAWAGLNLVDAARLLNDPALLDRAKQVFAYLESGIHSDPTHPLPGGVYWKETGNRDRNTVSTAGAALLAAELFEETGDRTYLVHAQTLYAWVEQHLKAPNGLYWDHVDSTGNIDRRQFSYNQGLMIGTAALLHRHTGSGKYLSDAQQLATLTLDHMARDDRWAKQSKAFNAIFFKNLMRLQERSPDPRFVSELDAYASQMHASVSPDAGLLDGGGRVAILDQAAAVQVQGYLWRELQRGLNGPGKALD